MIGQVQSSGAGPHGAEQRQTRVGPLSKRALVKKDSL
jgi:hypothetical protein